MRRWLFLLLLFLTAGLDAVVAQSDLQLRLGRPDVSDFPLVRINVLTVDSHSTPLADLSDLRLRENGTPIADFAIKTIPIGIDVVFVIDADETSQESDNSSELARYQQVQDSITRYATRFMSPSGLDQVTIVVPDANREDGRFLIQDVTEPAAVTEAMNSYTPESTGTTPLQEMMALAIDHAAQQQVDGRFQAILLFSDAGQLDQQLDYPTLVASAQAVNLPVFAAILGGQATLDEIQNVTRFAEPTRAFHVHMPGPADADPIYLIWQRQANQPQIEYRSLQTRSGRYPVTVNLGQVTASTVLELTIEPPRVAIQLEDDTVRRAGTAVDTPLAALEPARQPIPVLISWPDGLPRPLATVSLFVNDQPVFLPELPTPDDDGRLVLMWDIRHLDAGAYELVVEATDELGMAAASEPVILTVAVARPSPPTPTAMPTAAPAASIVIPDVTVYRDNLLLALAGLSLVAIALFWLRWRGLRRPLASVGEKSLPAAAAVAEPDPVSVDTAPLLASLKLLESAPEHETDIPVESDNVTLGRDQRVAQVVLDDKTVSRLHARIRRRDGAYWLYDEGSASGTFLNHERLGLSPRPLRHGDMVQLGRVVLRFHLQPAQIETEN